MVPEAHEGSSGPNPEPLHERFDSSEPSSPTCALPPSPTGSPFGTTATASQSKGAGSGDSREHNDTPPADAVPLEAPAPTGQAPSESPHLDSTHAPPSTTARACRICFGEEEEGDELGRLLAPCLCRGTARYVHQDCLRSWREADKLNSFYACGQCGERYRFRKTRVTALLGSRRATTVVSIVLLLLTAVLAGFAADPLMRLADADALVPNSKTGKLELQYHIFDEHLVAGDGIREAVSTAGYLLGDCTWASPRETMQHQRVIRTWKTEEGADVTVSTMDNKRAETTKCAKRWGRERDDEVHAGPLLAVLLHFVKGLATVSWLYMAGTRVLRQWILFAMTVRFVWPRVGNRLPFNIFRDLRTIGASLLGDGAKTGRTGTKKLRRRGEIVHWGQTTLHAMCVIGLLTCYSVAQDAARKLVKRSLLRVEDLVLDRDDVPDEREKQE